MLARLLSPRGCRWHAVLVLGVCALVYWPLLGTPGFGSSEGHRVGPAWRMLETGEWWRIELLGRAYLRKPPGMPWAIAVSSWAFGETEFAARAVSALSATVMALVALWFGNRWFGRPWGLAAGLAQALTPVFVLAGRVAEIEALNALGTQVCAFAVLDLLMRGPRVEGLGEAGAVEGGRRAGMVALGAAGLCIAVLAKGPASMAALVAAVLGAGVTLRSARAVLRPELLVVLGASAAVLVPIAVKVLGAVGPGERAVVQDFSEFTWASARPLKLLAMPFAALLAAAPTSAALFFPFGAGARREGGAMERGCVAARALAVAWVLNVLFLVAMGVTNPRYAMPGAVFLAPLVAFVARGLSRRVDVTACALGRWRRLAARVCTLGHPVVWPVLMLGLAVAWIPYSAQRPRHSEGREAGRALAAALPEGAEVWANDLVEARPDVLLYAKRFSGVRARWMPEELRAGTLPGAAPGAGLFLLLRTDEESDEQERYGAAIERGQLAPLMSGRVAKYSFTLLRVRAP